MIPRFKKSRFEPKPIETDYWVDLNANEFGGVYKYYDYNTKEWKLVQIITTEKEPQFTSSVAYSIKNEDVANWNSKPDLSYVDKQIGLLQENLDDRLSNVVIDNVVTTDVLQVQLSRKANKSDVYTKLETDDKLSTVAVPTKVSQLENDANYINQETLASKLPEDVVSDSNYVHTDNNFTDILKDKLVNITQYDDSSLTSSVTAIRLDLSTTNTNMATNTVNILDLYNIKADKTDLDALNADVYKKAELDNIMSQFVKKSHKSYGFCDERPTTDLTIEDTGFIFYDYTVNEPIIWVANEWRLLMSNSTIDGLHGIIKESDLLSAIGDWEYFVLDKNFSNIVNCSKVIESTTNLNIPNVYNGYFVLAVGDNHDYYKSVVKPFMSSNTKTYDSTGEKFNRAYLSKDLDFSYVAREINYDEVIKRYPDLFVSNIFNKPVMTIIQKDDGSYTDSISLDKTSLNKLTLGKDDTEVAGIKNIGAFSFMNVSLPTSNTLSIKTGVANVGQMAFAYSDIYNLEFPKNPIKINEYSFYNSDIQNIKISKNIDTSNFLNGEGFGAFAVVNEKTLSSNVEFENGVTSIPNYCFYKRAVLNDLVFPDSIKNIGYGAFYNSGVKGSFDSKYLEKIYGWCFRDNAFKSFIGRENLKIIAPGGLYVYNTTVYTTHFEFPPNLEKAGNYALRMPLGQCLSNINIPSTLTTVSYSLLLGYASSINTQYGNPTQDVELVINNGVKYIGPYAFGNCGFSNKLVFPESLVAIGDNAFTHCGSFSNEELFIPKNVKYIGGFSWEYVSGNRDVWVENQKIYDQLKNSQDPFLTISGKYTPVSPNGYYRFDTQQYLEDGGVVDNIGTGVFYGFAIRTMKRFVVDEENQWFTSVNGALYTKDLKRLISVPCVMSTEDGKFIMAEGCEIMDDFAFGRCGYNPYVTLRTNSGEIKEYLRAVPTISNMELGANLHTLVLADSYKMMLGDELTELNPYAPRHKYLENITYALYYSGIAKLETKETSIYHTAIDGVLYDKLVTTLCAISPFFVGDVNIPDTVTTIKPFMQILTDVDDEWEIEYKPVVKYSDLGLGSSHHLPVGIHIHIPASVINIEPLALRLLSRLNLADDSKNMHNSVDIDENNPKYTVDPITKYIVEK